MFFELSQWIINKFWPSFIGGLTKIIYSGKRVSFEGNLYATSIPRIIVDKGCYLTFGDNVRMQRHLEFRVHSGSKIIIEDDVRLDRGIRFLSANQSQIHIKSGTRIGLNSVFNGGDSIVIGKKTLISGFVYLQTSMHAHQKKDTYIQDQGFEHAPIFLGDNNWLGAHAVIMPGVNLGENCIVGSNAVVTKSFGNDALLVGAPATNKNS